MSSGGREGRHGRETRDAVFGSGGVALAALVAVVAALLVAPGAAWAATVGAFEVAGGTKEVDYSYENGVLTI